VACVHHWVLTDEIAPLSKKDEKLHPNCWGRRAKCKKCRLEKAIPEQLWEPPGNNPRGRGRRPSRTGSSIARQLQQPEPEEVS